MSKEEIKLALEVLKAAYVPADLDEQRERAITAFETELAKPDFWEGYVPEPVKPAQQEPVAKMGMYEHKCPNVTGHRGPSFVCQKAGHGVGQNSYCKGCICPEALNTSQPAPVQQGWPSDCLVSEKAKQSGFDLSPMPNLLYTVRGNHAQLVNFARAMLAAAPQPAQQEPVAWLVECGGDSALVRHTENFPGIFAGNEFNKRPLVFGDKSPPSLSLAQQALDKMAENARELGLDYGPAQCKYPKCSYPCLDLPDCREAEQPAPASLTEKDIAGACLFYRHDFGLMDAMNRGLLMNQAREWARAFGLGIAAIKQDFAAPVPAQEEPIYQCQDSTGKWTDQAKHSYDYNVKHGSATVRIVYAAPQPAPVPAQQEPLFKPLIDLHPGLAEELKAMDTSPPAQRKPLTDDQIRGLTPKPDGIAESNAMRVEVLPGVMGTEYDEVDAWSMPLVMQIARAIEAAHNIKEKNNV